MSDFDHIDTWEQKPLFKVRRIGVDGPLFIPIEAHSDPILPMMDQGFLSLELKEAVSMEEANALLAELREKVAFVTYTGEPAPEWNDQPGRGEQAGRRKAKHSA